ncbi:MAG: hypothetical protein JSU66_12600 [Deltaproteobacteria bacterium]|nr:MAG: hypothetical protein JSU66_12600 [Deltaproteobacteria bacterium]
MSRSTKMLLALLLIAGVGGAFNYQRNVAAEARQLRPYRSYSDADLTALLAAYRADADQLAERYVAAKQARSKVRSGGLIDEQVREFERVQQRGAQVRDAGAQISMREADIADMEREMRLREQEQNRLMLFLRRVATL